MVVNIVNELNIVGGGDNKAGRVSGSSRMMYFRDTGLIDAKSRFVGMPDKLPLSAKNFLEAFKMGVTNSQTVRMSEKEMKKQIEKEKKESEIQYQTAVKQEEKSDTQRKEQLITDVKSAMKSVLLKKDATTTAELQKLLKEFDVSNEESIGSLTLTKLKSLHDKIVKI